MELDNCNPLNLFLNMQTGQLECLPGVLIPPPGYSQLAPEVTVTPESNKPKLLWLLLTGAAVLLIAKK